MYLIYEVIVVQAENFVEKNRVMSLEKEVVHLFLLHFL